MRTSLSLIVVASFMALMQAASAAEKGQECDVRGVQIPGCEPGSKVQPMRGAEPTGNRAAPGSGPVSSGPVDVQRSQNAQGSELQGSNDKPHVNPKSQ